LLEITQLQQIRYFSALPNTSTALKELAIRSTIEYFEAEQLLFLEGDSCRGLYYLAAGQVRLFKSGPDGREQVMQILKAGATFNETAVLDGGCLPTSAEAVEASEVWILPVQPFLTLLEAESGVARAVLYKFAREMRQLTELVAAISLKHVTARVARILLEQVEQDSILGVGISNAVTAQLTQQQLAAMVGTVREMVGRALRTLQKAGAIEARRGHIIIKDVRLLQKVTS
jgi:CRP/FNR family transcriptional regulator